MDQNTILTVSLVSSATGIIILMLKLMFKSKCSNISCCCGLFQIKREVQLETELEPPDKKKNESKNEINSPMPIGLPQNDSQV
jgi:hypothetical protein